MLAAAGLTVCALAVSGTATAGSYDVYSCTFGGTYHGPNGAWTGVNSSLGGDATCVPLEPQAFQPGRGWRTVASTRSGGGGRFGFPVRLRPIAAYPYARGASRPLRIRVG